MKEFFDLNAIDPIETTHPSIEYGTLSTPPGVVRINVTPVRGSLKWGGHSYYVRRSHYAPLYQ